MALPYQYMGPEEVAFLCESEMVTIIPRQKMEGLDLVSVSRALPCPGWTSLQANR